MSSFTQDHLRRHYELLLGALLGSRLKEPAPVSGGELTALREKVEDVIQSVEDRVSVDTIRVWSREEMVEQHALGAAMDLLLAETVGSKVSTTGTVDSGDSRPSPVFVVLVSDNFDYMSTPYTDSQHTDPELALDRCRAIVELSLKESYKPGMTPGELYDLYRSFGEDPYVTGPDAPKFSAWDYALQRAGEICKAGGTAP